jgi:hypothetical protein
MNALKVKHDCFAYNKYKKDCYVLNELVCLTGKCKFYKTAKKRCGECERLRKEGRVHMTCEDCKKKGIIKSEV